MANPTGRYFRSAQRAKPRRDTTKVVPLHPDRPRHRKPRIFVAEDNRSFRKVIVGILVRAGYAVTAVEDGNRAVERLSEGIDNDLVILDLSMPGYNGIEVFQFLQASCCGATRPPVLTLTAADSREIRERCESLGFARVITKPVHFDRLLATIDECLGQRAVPVRTFGPPDQVSIGTRRLQDAAAAAQTAPMAAFGEYTARLREIVQATREALHKRSRDRIDKG